MHMTVNALSKWIPKYMHRPTFSRMKYVSNIFTFYDIKTILLCKMKIIGTINQNIYKHFVMNFLKI